MNKCHHSTDFTSVYVTLIKLRDRGITYLELVICIISLEILLTALNTL